MNWRWARALLRLYPAAVRRRYGDELLELQRELRTRGELSRSRLIRDALAGALLARSPRRRRLILAAPLLVAVVLVAVGLGLPQGRPTPIRPHDSTPVAVAAAAVVPRHDGLPYGSACAVGSGSCSLTACSVFVDQASPPPSSGSAVLATVSRRAVGRSRPGCTAASTPVRPEAIPVSMTSVMSVHVAAAESRR